MTEPDLPEPRPLAYEDRAFLEGDAARPLRILSEYLHPVEAFSTHGVHDTVVFFGSARIREDGPLGRYYTEACTLAREFTEWSLAHRPDGRRCIICSGGGGGIMEAANRGATEAGGRTIGLNITLPREQRPNPFITPGLGFEFRYFFMRKLWFAHLARAMVAFPGGYGTLDEIFELLTLSQTGKLERPIPILLYGEEFWREVIDFDALVRHGTIDARERELFRFVDDVPSALAVLRSATEACDDSGPLGFARSRGSADDGTSAG